MNKLIILGAFAAGLAGGLASRFLLPEAVQAQSAAAKEIRAQSFILEDVTGQTIGSFSSNPVPESLNGSAASIRLFDRQGREVWRAGGPPFRRLAEK